MRDQLNTKKCIVLGANGYIGRHLVKRLIVTGLDVKTYDLHDQSQSPEAFYNRIDITNKDSLNSIDWDVDLVFVFAGITGTYAGFNNYSNYVNINEVGILHILDCIRNSRFRPRLIFPSTRLVYKGSEIPIKESDQKEPKTIYAANKLVCEYLLDIYSNTFDIPYTIYRICVPYGNFFGSDYSYGTVGAFLNQATKNSCIRLYGNGELRRTFTHVEDICLQLIESCSDEKSLNMTFNTIGENYSLKEVASLIAHKFNSTIEFIDWPDNDARIESGSTVFDSSTLSNLFNLKLSNSIHNWVSTLSYLEV